MMSRAVLGYPYRTQVAFATLLAVGLVLCVMPIDTMTAWAIAGVATLLGVSLLSGVAAACVVQQLKTQPCCLL